jgi:hypothetical protein
MMTTDREPSSDQKMTIERLLNDEQVLIHLNPQHLGVTIPPHLRDNRTVTLRLSRFFKGSMSTDEHQITAELLFGSEYFTCEIPWSSIWGASSVRGEEFVWTEAAPPEILTMVLAHEESSRRYRAPEYQSRVTSTRASVPHLRRVK